MWTRLGVDLTNSVTVCYHFKLSHSLISTLYPCFSQMNIAAYHYAEGGVQNADSMSGGGGSPGGNGTMGGGPGGNSTSGGAPPSGSGGMPSGGMSNGGNFAGSATGIIPSSAVSTGTTASSTLAADQPAYTCLCTA